MPLMLIDKDGTLVRPKSGERFVKYPWDQEAIASSFKAIKNLHWQNWTVRVISNQGGVEFGHKTLESAKLEMFYLMQEVYPGLIQGCYFCPDMAGIECYVVGQKTEYHNISRPTPVHETITNFRKPSDGMLQLAAYDFLKDEIFYCGDRAEDEEAALAFGCEFITVEDLPNFAKYAGQHA